MWLSPVNILEYIQETAATPSSYPEPLVLTTNGAGRGPGPGSPQEGPLNFSTPRRGEREREGEDSGDEDRLVIKE